MRAVFVRLGNWRQINIQRSREWQDSLPIIPQELRLRQQQRTTEPPDPARVFAWKSRMSDIEKERFALVAGGLLRDLGYEA